MRMTTSLVLMFCSSFLIAQNAEDYSLTKAYGFDMTFINSFIPLDNNIGLSSPYLIYIHTPKDSVSFKRKAFGLSFSGLLSNSSDQDRDIFDNFLSVDLRFGSGKTKALSQKWDMQYGVDFLTEFNLSSNESFNFNATTSKVETIGLSLGCGPFLALSYKINDRVSLYTEAVLYLKIFGSRFTVKTEVNEIQENISTSSQYGYRSDIRYPSTLVLFYKF